MSTHISSGADEVLASAAEEAGPVDPLDTLLKQIVEGYFVLTDGQGSVSKWSEPAELLFGRPAQEILGQSFFGTHIRKQHHHAIFTHNFTAHDLVYMALQHRDFT